MKTKYKVGLILVVIGVAGISGFLYYRWEVKPSLTYHIEKISECGYSKGENLAITTSGDVVIFEQHLAIYSNALDALVLDMSVEREEIVIREIWDGGIVARCVSLFRITGTINNLESGTYHIIFNLAFPEIPPLESKILYERNVTLSY